MFVALIAFTGRYPIP